MAETVRVPTARLSIVLLQAEELLAVKLATGQRATELRELRATLTAWQRVWTTLRPEVHQVQRWCEAERSQNGYTTASPAVHRLLEWVHGQQEILQSLDTRLTALTKAAEHDHKTLGAMAEHLLSNMKQVLMLPFTALLEGFPRLVRDMARSQGKEVEFVMHGGDLEIDRRILEEMKDPLMHLVRNCIDHGIEKPAERAQKQKPPRGRIAITVTQKDSRSVELRIADDGMGIDVAKVKARPYGLEQSRPRKRRGSASRRRWHSSSNRGYRQARVLLIFPGAGSVWPSYGRRWKSWPDRSPSRPNPKPGPHSILSCP